MGFGANTVTGRFPQLLTVDLTLDSDAEILISGLDADADALLEFGSSDAAGRRTAVWGPVPRDEYIESEGVSMWGLPPASVAELWQLNVCTVRILVDETIVLAGPVRWGSGWGGRPGTGGVVRIISGPRGEMGPPGDWSLILDPVNPGLGIMTGPVPAFVGDGTFINVPIGV